MSTNSAQIAEVEAAIAAAQLKLQQLRSQAADLHRQHRGATGQPVMVEKLDGSCTAADILAALRRDGVVVIDRLASAGQMDRLAAELAKLEPYAYRAEPGSFSGSNTISNGSYLVAACPTAQGLALHPLLLKVAEQLLSPHARGIALAVASEIKVVGEGPAQVLHRDDEEWPLDLLAAKKSGAELELLSMWAVSDFSKENGATNHCPGSHTWPADRAPQPDEITQVEMLRGSVLLWLGSALHGAGPSVAEVAERHGLLLGYCLSWLRPEMNMHFTCPPKVAAQMDERMSSLLGFAGSHRYGPHPYISGPVYATEYNGYPGASTDYGQGGLYNGGEGENTVSDDAPRGFLQATSQSKL